MKKLSLLLLTLTVCFFTACHKDIWAELENLDQRVTKLEELCKEMNTNITSLQTIVSVLQSNDFITGIVEIKKNGEVIGYTITFGKHDPITIYHGQDGKDGADGKDGQDGQNGSANAPVIGVAQDTDGVYYWTLNGEWLLDDNGNKLPVSGKDGQNGSNGSNGQDGADGKDGEDGEDGKDGADGQDGITPQLKIEEGYWYISYDNGATWTQLGKATGEDGKDGADGEDGKDGQNGTDGKDGQDGDSMFQSVTQDENYVYFTLADGTVIKIAKGNSNDEEQNPDDIIDFTDFNVRLALIELGVDTNKDGEISYAEAASITRLDFSSHKFTSFREFKYFTNLQAVSFYNTGVREIVFPENSIDSILDNAFQGTKLKNLTIPEGTKCLGAKAFYNSTIENLFLPNSITGIGEEAFVGSAITSFVFPSMITYMPEGSFEGCENLKEFRFPENYCGEPFLFGLGGENISPLSILYWDVIHYEKDFYIDVPNGSVSDQYYGIAAARYYNTPYQDKTYPNKTIKSVIFGDNVKTIPNYLCAYMGGLTGVIFSNNIESIGKYAFYECSALTEIHIPNSVTNIGTNAFMYCSALTSTTIGANISEIGTNAFYGCSSLKYLYIKANTPPALGNGVIPSTIGIIYVPRSSVEDYKTVWSSYADKIVGYDFE